MTRHLNIRLIHVVGDRFTGHSLPALWEEAKLGLSDVRSIERIAVVTDVERFRALVKGGGWILPGQVKLVSNAERVQAEAWVTEGLPVA